jgi:hypothetical protein
MYNVFALFPLLFLSNHSFSFIHTRALFFLILLPPLPPFKQRVAYQFSLNKRSRDCKEGDFNTVLPGRTYFGAANDKFSSYRCFKI